MAVGRSISCEAVGEVLEVNLPQISEPFVFGIFLKYHKLELEPEPKVFMYI